MTTAQEIKQAILDLPEAEYAELVEWLYELSEAAWEEWDRQFEEDALSGKLDFLAAEAWEAKERGELRCLPTK